MRKLSELTVSLTTEGLSTKVKELQVTDIRDGKYYVGRTIYKMDNLQVQNLQLDLDENISIYTFCLEEDTEETLESLKLAVKARLLQKSRSLNSLFEALENGNNN